MNTIKKLRKKEKLNQREFADLFNVHQTAVSQWETGKTTPDTETLSKIADYFDVSIDYLLGKSDMKKSPEITEEMIEGTKKIFSKNLCRLLSIHDITQAELANILNVSPASISGWCTGDKMPRMNKIEKIAQYFGVQKSDLIEDHSGQQAQEDEQYQHLKELAAKMDEDSENGVVILHAKGKSQKSYRIPEEKMALLEMLAKELMKDDD